MRSHREILKNPPGISTERASRYATREESHIALPIPNARLSSGIITHGHLPQDFGANAAASQSQLQGAGLVCFLPTLRTAQNVKTRKMTPLSQRGAVLWVARVHF